MSAKAIREATGKDILNRHLLIQSDSTPCRFATVTEDTNWAELVEKNPWLQSTKLVVKPDQLIKRRGKYGLIAINKTLAEVQAWVKERMGKDIKIDNCEGKLRNFIIEPFLPHKDVSTFDGCGVKGCGSNHCLSLVRLRRRTCAFIRIGRQTQSCSTTRAEWTLVMWTQRH